MAVQRTITGNYTLVADPMFSRSNNEDLILDCDTSVGPVNIQLPPISDFKGANNIRICVNDSGGMASVNNITLIPDAADDINGVASSIVINVDKTVANMNIASSFNWAYDDVTGGGGGPSVNIYNSNGVVTSNRTVELNSKGLHIKQLGAELVSFLDRELWDGFGFKSYSWINRALFDETGIAALDHTTQRALLDNGGSPSLVWNTRQLLDGFPGDVALDWMARQMYDNAFGNVLSIDWQARSLYDVAGVNSADWAARLLSDSSNNTSLNYQLRILLDAAGNNAVDWENKQMADSAGVPSLFWNSRILYDSLDKMSANWDTRAFYDPNELLAIDNVGRRLTATDQQTSVDWQNYLLAVGGGVRMNWDTQIMFGEWEMKQDIDGPTKFLISNSDAGASAFAEVACTNNLGHTAVMSMLSSTAFGFPDAAAYGSFDASYVAILAGQIDGFMIDKTFITSLSWQNRALHNALGTDVFEWSSVGVALPNYATLDYVNDAAAAGGGVVLGGLYHTAGVAKIRVV